MDGEIVCCDARGRPDFNALLFRRGTPSFYAFDLLWFDGEDVRERPLLERKRMLRRLVPRRSDHLHYVDHVRRTGTPLFARACAEDLEGIVAKWAAGVYRIVDERTSWIKVKNASYSQAAGRAERFTKWRRHG